MVQSGLRRTVGVWLHFIVGVKDATVDWKLACVRLFCLSERPITLSFEVSLCSSASVHLPFWR